MKVIKIIAFCFAIGLLSGCASSGTKARCPSSNLKCKSLLQSPLSSDIINELPTTIGFEFEGSLPIEMEFSTLAERIKQFLSGKFPNDKIEISFEPSSWFENTYHIVHYRGPWEDRYTVKPETGLHFDKSTDPEIKGVEITAPILRTRQQAVVYFEVLEDLRSLGLKSRSDLAGNHIHWGLTRDFTYAQLLRVYQATKKLLKIFEQDFAYDRGRERWIDIPHFLSVVSQLEEFVKNNPNAKVFEADFQPALKRTVLRLVATYRTLEIRIFNSNINPEVNLFELDFALALFSVSQTTDSPLYRYLMTTENPSRDRVLKLMGLDLHRAERAFSWSQRRNQDLRASLEQRKLVGTENRYVQPNEVEQKVDHFLNSGAEITPQSLLAFFKSLPESQINIGVFNLVNTPHFEGLTADQRIEFLQQAERSMQLEPYVQREFWAIRSVSQSEFSQILYSTIKSMKGENVTVLHPLIRHMLKQHKRQPDDISSAIASLAKNENVLLRFLISFEKFLVTKRVGLDSSHIAFLSSLVAHSKNPEVGLRCLKLLSELKFELRDHRHLVPPFFIAIESLAKRSRLVSLEVLQTLDGLARNDFAGPDSFISNHASLLQITSQHFSSGFYPKLLAAWIVTLNAFKAHLNPTEKERFLKELEGNIPQLPRDLTATERVNIKLALENLLKGETSPVAPRLKEIKF